MSAHKAWMIKWTEYDFGQRSDGTDFCLTQEAVDARLETASAQFRPSTPRAVIIDGDLYSKALYGGKRGRLPLAKRYVHIPEWDEKRLVQTYSLKAEEKK